MAAAPGSGVFGEVPTIARRRSDRSHHHHLPVPPSRRQLAGGVHRLPLTYLECRARFERAAVDPGLSTTFHPITARGPHDEELGLHAVRLGARRPRRALLVMSGLHGVEGYIGSTLQADLLTRLDTSTLPGDVGVVVIHAVNPWGIAWWRRQNEHNVDLNRNWRRSDSEPVHNDAYDEIHHRACPDTDDLPSIDELFAATSAMVRDRGLAWVRDAITSTPDTGRWVR